MSRAMLNRSVHVWPRVYEYLGSSSDFPSLSMNTLYVPDQAKPDWHPIAKITIAAKDISDHTHNTDGTISGHIRSLEAATVIFFNQLAIWCHMYIRNLKRRPGRHHFTSCRAALRTSRGTLRI